MAEKPAYEKTRPRRTLCQKPPLHLCKCPENTLRGVGGRQFEHLCEVACPKKRAKTTLQDLTKVAGRASSKGFALNSS